MRYLLLVAAIAGIVLAGCKKDKEITLESISVTSQPTKKTYNVGDAFDPAGMTVTATYSNKSTKPVALAPAMFSYDFNTAGTNKTVDITYTENGKTATATVTGITVKELVSIVVTSEPTKKTYTAGESFNSAGMVVTATYSDNSTAEVPLSDLEFEYDFSTAGEGITVTLTYKGTSITAEITGITVIELVSIAVTTQPNKKTYFVGEAFNPTGMVVTATYNDGSTATVNITAGMLDYDFSTAGVNKTVAITYRGKPAEVSGITVNELSFSGGDGLSAATAYEISLPIQLAWLAKMVNEGTAPYAIGGVYYKLTADIDLSDYGAGFNDGKGWIPIYGFRDNFDGAGYTVSGLYINDDALFNYVGLFGNLSGGTIANLGVTDVNIKGFNDVGGVAGVLEMLGSITNCYVTGAVSGNSSVGGVAGRIWGGNITNCYAAGTVSGNSAVGGVVGSIIPGNSVSNCAALNPSITRTGSGTNTYFGRVAGYVGENILNNNAALEDMQALGGITFGEGAHDNFDGEDITPAEAKQQATYTNMGWDFTTVWKIDEGVGYPKLVVSD